MLGANLSHERLGRVEKLELLLAFVESILGCMRLVVCIKATLA